MGIIPPRYAQNVRKCGAEFRAFALIVGAVSPLRVDLEQHAGLGVPELPCDGSGARCGELWRPVTLILAGRDPTSNQHSADSQGNTSGLE